MFDTHCHLTFREFAGRAEHILVDAQAAGVRGAITVATTPTDCRDALALAEQHAHRNLWCTAGMHPLYSDQPRDWPALQHCAGEPRCVAWGELGLDNHYPRPLRHVQHEVLSEQLSLIERCQREHPRWRKPIVLHCRQAFDDLIAVLRHSTIDAQHCVFHCFTGTADDARRVLDFGAWISFTGVVTFTNAGEVQAAARLAPADRIMVETDAPFLTPEPVRKIRPNEPKFVVHIARKLAQLRGVDAAELERQLDDNTRRFFGIEF